MSDEKGFVLITVLLLLLLLSVTALTLNSRAGLQGRMARNQRLATQAYLDQMSAMESALWQLCQTPLWRTSGETYTYNNATYTRKVQDAAVTGNTDAFTLSVTQAGSGRAMKASYRYYMDTAMPTGYKKPYRLRGDGSGNIYFADMDGHSVWKIAASSQQVSRVAGTGNSGFSGDGGQATSAQLSYPQGIAIDGSGNIYIADTGNHRIRRVTAAGVISTYAGTGDAAYLDGPRLSAKFNSPEGLMVDGSGNLYVADAGNHMIRKIDAATVTCIAGNGTRGSGGDGGPATSAQLNSPSGVFRTSAGDVYIADTGNHRIRKVDSGGAMRPFAGTGTAGYSDGDAASATFRSPSDVYVSSASYTYVADTDNSCIRRIAPSAPYTVETRAGTGTAGYDGDGWAASWARLDRPAGVYVSGAGEMYIADTMNCTVRKVSGSWHIISTIATVSPAAGLDNARKIAPYYDATTGKLYMYFADTSNHRVRRLDVAANTVTTIAGTGVPAYGGDGGPAVAASLNQPHAVLVDAAGALYIGDTENHRIRKVTPSGTITTYAGTGVGDYGGDGGTAVNAQLNRPKGMFLDASGTLYFTDSGNCVLRKINAGGSISLVGGRPKDCSFNEGANVRFNNPSGVWKSSAGTIYVADTDNNRIRKFTEGGAAVTVAGTGSPGYSGDGGQAGTAQLTAPTDVLLDASGGIFVADSGNHAIRAITTDGKIRCIAGAPPAGGYNGENTSAVAGRMNLPNGIALAGNRGSGRIYIADSGNNRLRVLSLRKVKELY